MIFIYQTIWNTTVTHGIIIMEEKCTWLPKEYNNYNIDIARSKFTCPGLKMLWLIEACLQTFNTLSQFYETQYQNNLIKIHSQVSYRTKSSRWI